MNRLPEKRFLSRVSPLRFHTTPTCLLFRERGPSTLRERTDRMWARAQWVFCRRRAVVFPAQYLYVFIIQFASSPPLPNKTQTEIRIRLERKSVFHSECEKYQFGPARIRVRIIILFTHVPRILGVGGWVGVGYAFGGNVRVMENGEA